MHPLLGECQSSLKKVKFWVSHGLILLVWFCSCFVIYRVFHQQKQSGTLHCVSMQMFVIWLSVFGKLVFLWPGHAQASAETVAKEPFLIVIKSNHLLPVVKFFWLTLKDFGKLFYWLRQQPIMVTVYV